MLGCLLVSIFAGGLMFATSLFYGFGVWWSLMAYSASGMCVFVITAALIVLNAGKTRSRQPQQVSGFEPYGTTGIHAEPAPVFTVPQHASRIVATQSRHID